ncbi:MAG: hypothetical protein HKN24_08210 [Acidimicrobiales bacterium]|nr:hypothetical protein [Acidimicrobiales bacterium]
MATRADEFGPDVEFALVTFSDPKYLRAYRARTGWTYPILVDVERTLYRRFGYGRGSLVRVYGWAVLRRYWRILRRDGLRAYHLATEDTLQLGGNVVIGPDGLVSWVYRGAGPDDRPPLEQIIAEVEKARASRR